MGTLIRLYDRNNLGFISGPSKNNRKNMVKIEGNTKRKQIKDRNNKIVLHQTYDSFWSYCTPQKRAQFLYESYSAGNGKFHYKLSVSDDPMCHFRSNNVGVIYS